MHAHLGVKIVMVSVHGHSLAEAGMKNRSSKRSAAATISCVCDMNNAFTEESSGRYLADKMSSILPSALGVSSLCEG